ncbi:MAG: sulfite exporter TauE/SafE family protein [Gaiellaceae bacterium]
MNSGTWQFVLLGLGVGTLVGMTGMGGGSLMTPLLILVFGFDPGKAVGTDLMHGAIFKSFGAARHHVLGTIHKRLVLWMLCGSVPMSLVGVWLSHRLGDGAAKLQTRIIAAALILGGIGFLAKTFLRRGAQADETTFLLRPRDRAIALALGSTGGFVVGLTSVGSGTFFGLVMLLAFPLSARQIVGTDIFHAAALCWVAGLGHVVGGNVSWHALLWMLPGSIPGIMIGSQVSVGIPDRVLRVAFSTVLLLSGFKLLDPLPGRWTDIAVLVGLVLSALAFAAWGGSYLLSRRSPAARPLEELSPP